MRFATAAFAATTLASSAYAHMQMINPPPFRGKTNPNTQNIDFNMVAPLELNGSNFPCKGYQVDFGTPAGAPTAQWPAGSVQSFTLEGIEAAHNGGSCQASISYDGGATFKVVKSFIGNCVRSLGGNVFAPEQTYSFTVPADAQAGQAIFSWTWFNQSGNREMYQNCAAVEITGTGTSTLSNLPDYFVANVANGCAVPEGVDVAFPNPGADIETGRAANGAGTGAPSGNCGGGAGAAAPPPPPPDAGVIAAPPPAAGGASVVVAAGDTCEAIAARNGVTAAQLIANNGAVNAGCTNLAVGQTLVLRRRSRIMKDTY